MKKGIRIFMAAALTVAAVNANAQFGIHAGYVNSPLIPNGNTDQKMSLNGFRVGVSDDIRLVAGLSLRPGINYVFAMDSEKNSASGINITAKQQEHFLAVPIDVKYAFRITDNFKIYAFAGPRFAAGLASISNMDLSGNILGQSISGSISYNSYTNKMKSDDIPSSVIDALNNLLANTDEQRSRFDIQFGFGAGVKLGPLFVELGYDWGLLNLYKGDYADSNTLKRNQFFVGVGLTF